MHHGLAAPVLAQTRRFQNVAAAVVAAVTLDGLAEAFLEMLGPLADIIRCVVPPLAR